MDKNINAANTPDNLPEATHVLSADEYLKETLDESILDNDVEWFAEYQKDPDTFLTSLKIRLKENKKSYWKRTEWLKDTDIDELGQKDLARIMTKKMQFLIDSRNRSFYLIKTHYPNIRQMSDWETKLRKHINEQDTESLTDLIKGIRSKNKVQKFFFWSDIIIPDDIKLEDSKKFSEVFHDIDDIWFSTPEFKKFVETLFAKHDKFGTIPKSNELRKVLEAYRDVSSARKKEILVALWATVSLKMAHQYNLISEDITERYLRDSFGQIYERLTQDEKRAFRNQIINLHPEIIQIDADDLDVAELDDFFQNKQSLKKIANNILENRITTTLWVTENLWNILSKAVKQFPDEEDHQILFNKYVDRTVKNEKWESIPGILDLQAWSIVEFEVNWKKKYFEILRTHDDKNMPLDVDKWFSSWVRVRELPTDGGILKNWAEEWIAYDTLYGFFQNYKSTVSVLSSTDFQSRLSTVRDEEWKIFDARDILSGDDITQANISLRLDTVDPDGRAYGFDVGTYFSSPEAATNWWFGETRIWKVASMDSAGAEILSEQGTIREFVSYDELFWLAEGGRLKRKHKITDDEWLLSSLKQEAYGSLRSTAWLKDGLLFQKNKDEKWNDIEETIRVFAGDGSHIRVDGISGWFVTFWEYVGEDDEFKATNYARKNGSKKAFQKFYNIQTLTYGAFVEYINKNKLSASKDDIIDDHAHDHHEHDHSHAHGSLLSRIWKMQTLSSMWKWLELVWHSFEHTLEKWAKLDAARFAMKISKFIPNDSLEAQIYADIVDGSKETVEKYKNKIANLPGPKGRWKCIHIAHNLDARPEEVMAAIQFMVSSYGHLYAEDTKHYQSVVTKSNLINKPRSYFSYLDAFILTSGLPGSLVYWRQKAYEKAKPEVEGEWEPPEEQLLHALFKSIDGNPEKYPYAASVVKAIGWPGGFEKDWKFEGTKNAMQKWRDQTTMVNAQWRLNKAVWYLTTHEFYKAIWGMEKVAWKNKTPKYQALPFIWAVWGYSKFVSPTSLQEIKNYAEMGFSFHGYSFMRRESDNMIYRDTVRLALWELSSRWKIPAGAMGEFNKICERMDHGPEDTKVTDNEYNKVPPPKAMMLFWQEYADKWLHDMLQGHDGWLTKMSKENSTVEKYRLRLVDWHSNQLKNANIPTSENGAEWYEEHGLGYNGILRSTDEDGFVSIYSNLNKIKFTWTNRWWKPMDGNNKEKIWDYQVKRIVENRNIDKFYGDIAMQKKQYMIWRSELINYFAEQLSAATVRNDIEQIEQSIRQYPYFRDFERMGIDPKAIFLSELVDQNEEADYQAWLTGWRNVWVQSAGIINQIRGKGTKVFDQHSGLKYRDSDEGSGSMFPSGTIGSYTESDD